MEHVTQPKAGPAQHASATAQGPAPALAVGTVLADRYRLDALLGRGGGGMVYQAVDLRTDTTVALKVLDAARSREFDVVRFKREFRAAARLNHPTCVRVFEAGQAGSHHYLSMEYMPGGDLTRWVAQGPEQVAALALQVLAGLDHLHAKNIVHRDIKPQNILLRTPPKAGEVPSIGLSDLGIAKVSDLDDQLGAGAALGTEGYIAPEQLESGAADPRSDLFSLGVILYEKLTGQLPWPKSMAFSVSHWLAVRRRPPVALLEDKAGLPKPLCAIVMRLLAYDAQQRFVTAAAAYAALHDWLQSTAPQLLGPAAQLHDAAYLAPAQFVGRAAELAAVHQFVKNIYEPTADNHPVLMSISGPAGMGKTKLLSQALRAAELSSVLVEVATCRSEPAPAFEPISHLMHKLMQPSAAPQANAVQLDADNDEDAGSTLAGPPRPRAAPAQDDENGSTLAGPVVKKPTEQAATAPNLQDLLADNKQDARWDLYRRLSEQLLQITANTPLLVALEDAQWADGPTLQFLTYLVRAVASAKRRGQRVQVGFLITHRDNDDDQALADLYRAGQTEQTVHALPLQPLSNDAATELVASMLMVPADAQVQKFADGLTSGAENNPLYLAQVLHALLTRGQLRRDAAGWRLRDVVLENVAFPRTIRDAIGERAARLSAHTKNVLTGAAVLGRRFDFATMGQVTHLDEAVLLDSLDEALREGFIEERSGEVGGYTFTHDRFREAIYDRLPEGERRNLHRTIVHVLELRPTPPESELAHHFRHCDEFAHAYEHAVRAADQSVRSFAYVQAHKFFKDAFQDAEHAHIAVPTPLRETYAEVCDKTGNYSEAEQIYHERLKTNLERDDRVALLRKVGQLELNRGTMLQAVEPLVEVVRLMGAPVLRGDFQLALGFVSTFLVVVIRSLLPIRMNTATGVQGKRLTELTSAYGALAHTLYFDSFMGCAYYQVAAIVAAMKLGPSTTSINVLSSAGYGMAHIGLTRLSHRFLQIASAWVNEATTSHEARGWLLTMKSMVALMEGRIRDAVQYAREAQRVLTEARMPMIMRTSLMFEGEGLLALGQFQLARTRGEALWLLACEVDDREGKGFAKYVLGDAHVRMGLTQEGYALFAESVQFSNRSGGTLSRIVTQGRWQLERAMQGEAVDACRIAHEEYRACIARGLRAWASQIYATGVAAAALQKIQTGSLPADVEKTTRQVLRRGRAEAKLIPAARPLMSAAEATWLWAQGRNAEGHRRMAQAMDETRALDMPGELFNVVRLACAAAPKGDAQSAAYTTMLNDLRAQLRQGDTAWKN